MILKTVSKNKYHLEFTSWHDLLRTAIDGKSGMEKSDRSSRIEGRPEFFATRTWPEAVKLARFGYHGIADEIESASKYIVDRMTNFIEKEEVIHDVEGHGIDVARFIDGEPECWQRIETVTSGGIGNRIVTILVNVGASSGVKASQFKNRGIIMCALVDILQTAGYSCKVVAYGCKIGDGDNFLLTSAVVKEPDGSMDAGRMAFALAHAGMYRRLFFSAWETLDSKMRTMFEIGNGYGMQSTNLLADVLNEDSDIDPIIFPGLNTNDGGIYKHDPKSEKVQTWIKAILADRIKFRDEVAA